MSLDNNKAIAEVGRRTRLRHDDVQKMLEALIEVWSDELADDVRIELENFLVLEVKSVDRAERAERCLSVANCGARHVSSRNWRFGQASR